jgi:hypothetical protein
MEPDIEAILRTLIGFRTLDLIAFSYIANLKLSIMESKKWYAESVLQNEGMTVIVFIVEFSIDLATWDIRDNLSESLKS